MLSQCLLYLFLSLLSMIILRDFTNLCLECYQNFQLFLSFLLLLLGLFSTGKFISSLNSELFWVSTMWDNMSKLLKKIINVTWPKKHPSLIFHTIFCNLCPGHSDLSILSHTQYSWNGKHWTLEILNMVNNQYSKQKPYSSLQDTTKISALPWRFL